MQVFKPGLESITTVRQVRNIPRTLESRLGSVQLVRAPRGSAICADARTGQPTHLLIALTGAASLEVLRLRAAGLCIVWVTSDLDAHALQARHGPRAALITKHVVYVGVRRCSVWSANSCIFSSTSSASGSEG